MPTSLRVLSLIVCLFTVGFLSAQQTVGLFQNSPEAYNGYTLFSNTQTTYLMDNCGALVHTWESDYPPGNSLYLLENGNLLRTARITGDFSGGGIGGRIEMFNWEGDLLWGYDHANFDYHHHHDIEPLPNGNFLLVAWERMSSEEAIANGRDTETVTEDGIWPEQIIEIEMVGNSEANWVWEWHLRDHLVQNFDDTKDNFGVVADHPELVNFNYPPGNINADWNHVNAISYNATLDQIAISAHRFDEIWIIDHSTTSEEAAGHTGGNAGRGGDLLYRWGNPLTYDRGTTTDQTLFNQHDIRWLPEGHSFAGQLMVFNNQKFGDRSAVDIWEPPLEADDTYSLENGEAYGPEEISWTYTNLDLFSVRISGAQPLPNNNILICEGTSGEFTEITLGGEKVWRYINPVSRVNGVTSQGSEVLGNDTFRATRYGADYGAFENKDLTPSGPIELDPLVSDCEIFMTTSVEEEEEKVAADIRIINTMVNESLWIENMNNISLEIEVYDLLGNLVAQKLSHDLEIEVSMEHVNKGIYFVQVTDQQSKSQWSLGMVATIY